MYNKHTSRRSRCNSLVWIQNAATGYPNNAANANAVNDRLAKVWAQIANRFKDYPDLLIFEGMNEIGFDTIWNRYQSGQAAQKAEAYRILNMLNQTFVNTVRTTGANNINRFLLIPGYWTDIQNTCDPLFAMPNDSANDKLMISVHYYTPWNFAGSTGSNATQTWGNTSQRNELNNLFNMMKTNFIDRGIPVILGEYNVIRARAEQQRINWLVAVTQKCIDLGISPVLWCNGGSFAINGYYHDMGDVLREGENSMMSSAMQAVWEQLVFP